MTSKRTRERMIQRLIEQGITDHRVLDVMAETPRHIFLDEALSHRAYEDTALPIGFGQTLSQPYIVARMTELLVQSSDKMEKVLKMEKALKMEKVLEVGTGSGYQTAVLSKFVNHLYSIERIKPLQDKARERLRKLGLYNVQMTHSDGSFGWKEKGPFNGILCTAAPKTVPSELLEQLAPDGVLVIPAGLNVQELLKITRLGDSDQFETQKLESVRFVPLLSGITR